jgi:hypothetical protein
MNLKAPLTNSETSSLKDIKKSNSIDSFQYSGKTRYNEMYLHDQAKFYLANCPDTIADSDGIPFEDQWCGH